MKTYARVEWITTTRKKKLKICVSHLPIINLRINYKWKIKLFHGRQQLRAARLTDWLYWEWQICVSETTYKLKENDINSEWVWLNCKWPTTKFELVKQIAIGTTATNRHKLLCCNGFGKCTTMTTCLKWAQFFDWTTQSYGIAQVWREWMQFWLDVIQMSSKIKLSQDDFQDFFRCSAHCQRIFLTEPNNTNKSFNYTSEKHLQSEIIDRFVIKCVFEWRACLINNDFFH